MTKILCPNCKRCLGETEHSIDAVLICKGCKEKVRVNLDVLSSNYFDYNANPYERRLK